MFKSFQLACLSAMAAGIQIGDTMKAVMTTELVQTSASAQTQAANHTCTSTADINKMSLRNMDFTTLRNGQYLISDPQFPAGDESMAWPELGEKLETDMDNAIWERAYKAFPGKTLFGDGISTDDIIQGSLGNCWFLSAASAVAEFPGRMEKIFLNKNDKGLNPQGVYGVNFYSLGVPHTVIIDDYLPLRKVSYYSDELGTMYSAPGKDGSLWTAIIEKAFAKLHGNYAHIEGGDPGVAIQTITGAPYERYEHSKMDKDDLWNRLVTHDRNNDIMSCVSPAGSDKTTDASGLVQGHAFTLIGTVWLSDGNRLLKIRNPHGSEKYHGAWSDLDTDNWTA